MNVLLQSVAPLPNFELALRLSNGEHRCFDVKPYLDMGVFKALKETGYFERVKSDPRFIYRPQRQDLSLDTLLARSVKV